MNYYYDIALNFDLEHIWKFYEWEQDDYFVVAKKIPLFRVSFDTICDFLRYEVMVDSSFCEGIAHKTVLKGSNESFYASFLLSDSKNSIGVLLDDMGHVVAISQLGIVDSNQVNEYIYTVNITEIPYQVFDQREIKHENRQKAKMKNFVLVELHTLMDNGQLDKMKYLYYEWFLEEESDMQSMYERMVQDLSMISLETLKHLDYVIRLSYHQV